MKADTKSTVPLQNRVLPTGEIIATSARGTLTGNRGIIHLSDRTLGNARWSHHAWICCTLEWQGRRRQVMTGRNWTELFFLDEATAFAAGHRPCGYCRRAAYRTFVDCWEAATGARPNAKVMDKALHTARVTRERIQITYDAALNDLPDGTFVVHQKSPHLKWQNMLHPYTPKGYTTPIAVARASIVSVLTPKPTVEILAAGYVPQVARA